MNLLRRPVTLFVTAAAASITLGSLLGVAAHSDAATPTPSAATAVTAGNPKVPNATSAAGPVFLRPGESLRSDDRSRSWLESGGLAAGSENVLATTTGFTLELEGNGDLV
ncbi:hypothetical protein ACXR2U_02350 [Jatrophihabitans sp. YIM 134969]